MSELETAEEIAARYAAKKEEDLKPMRNPLKIINATYFRDLCHARGVKISEEAIKEFADMNRRVLFAIIDDTKEIGNKVILRRHVEAFVK